MLGRFTLSSLKTIPALPPSGSAGPSLRRQLMLLAAPVLMEQLFHTVVGLTDTWLANNLPERATAATAAVGMVSYLLWFIGLIVGAIGTGSTALIARARGARHRRLANGVCGQSVVAALILGLFLAGALYAAAPAWISTTRLSPEASVFALSYLRMLTASLPFMTLMFVANACLRGAGDTLTPAIAMVVVDVVNVVFSFGLTYGAFGLPAMGFEGIAAGTVIAYVVGGVLQFVVLISGRGGVRLHLHRMRPHWLTMKRVLRIGVPSGAEGLLSWIAQYSVIIIINNIDRSNLATAAHMNAVKIESISFLPGFAFAMAAATMVGQSLGMKDAERARRATYQAYASAAVVMGLLGLVFIFAGRTLSDWMLPKQPAVAELTARCLFVAGFIQSGFAGAMVFSGALRGAGDTMVTMGLNLFSVIVVRLVGVIIVVYAFNQGIVGVWCVLCSELVVRGLLCWGRFEQGGWKKVEV